MDLGSILGSPLFNGDPEGFDIEDIYYFHPVIFVKFAKEQAAILHGMSIESNSVVFGQLQHSKIKPMFGRTGSIDFMEARKAWTNVVRSSLDKLYASEDAKETYISPFDWKRK